VETRVCQYENSPDGHLLFDRHPHAENVWLLGGGSGHGFKLSPALGEYAARIILDDDAPETLFALDRPGHGAATRTQFER
jgi:glycine/D-amino acid oxidase-like deaminating enzyme